MRRGRCDSSPRSWVFLGGVELLATLRLFGLGDLFPALIAYATVLSASFLAPPVEPVSPGRDCST